MITPSGSELGWPSVLQLGISALSREVPRPTYHIFAYRWDTMMTDVQMDEYPTANYLLELPLEKVAKVIVSTLY